MLRPRSCITNSEFRRRYSASSRMSTSCSTRWRKITGATPGWSVFLCWENGGQNRPRRKDSAREENPPVYSAVPPIGLNKSGSDFGSDQFYPFGSLGSGTDSQPDERNRHRRSEQRR